MVKKDETLESGSMKTDCPVCGGKGTAMQGKTVWSDCGGMFVFR